MRKNGVYTFLIVCFVIAFSFCFIHQVNAYYSGLMGMYGGLYVMYGMW